MWIVKLALRRPYTFVVMALLILLLGGVSIVNMSTDIFPTIDIPVVTVLWQYGGLTPDEMATRITTYSEYVTSSTVDNIRSIESQTLSGISVIKVFLQPGANVDGAIAQLAATSQTVLRFMPPGTQPPFILRYNASSVPILQLSLSSPTWSEAQLYDYGLYRGATGTGAHPGADVAAAVWRQAAPDHGGSGSAGSAGQGALAQ
jgi:multidrug efflux pump subunit AcrB